jgi:transposase
MEVWVINTGMPEDFSLAVSDTGYSNDELCLEWIKHFDRHTSSRQKGVYRMLIMDGYGSHVTLDFIRYCEEHKIIPFYLPPHSRRCLQPLNVALFRLYKKEHRDVLHKAM